MRPWLPLILATLSGTWNGTWSRGSDTLAVTMHFAQQNETWSGTFDSERLRVIGIPLTDVRVTPPRVEWKIAGDASTMNFTGELAGDVVAGKFEERGARGTFRLERMAKAEPQLEERDLGFANGGVPLAGTLLLPAGSKHAVPAVVFTHGSGAEGRWASKYLATRFARAGIAALIFDKRGAGQSGGDWKSATIDDLAGDAAAAVAELRKNPAIDPAKIGIHGHSQGGTLAPLVAARAPVSFVIASAAAGLAPDRVEIYSLEHSVGIDTLPAEDAALARRYIDTVVAVAYRGEPRQSLASVWKEVEGKPWAFRPPPEDSHYWSFSRNFQTFDPTRAWQKVSVPVLLVYGERDQRVPARPSAARIAQAILEGAGNSASVHIFPGADHTFRLRTPDRIWPMTVENYPDVLIEWTKGIIAALAREGARTN